MSLQDIICTFKYVELIISSILITLKTTDIYSGFLFMS